MSLSSKETHKNKKKLTTFNYRRTRYKPIFIDDDLLACTDIDIAAIPWWLMMADIN